MVMFRGIDIFSVKNETDRLKNEVANLKEVVKMKDKIHGDYIDENFRLTERLIEAEKVIEFYADYDNWKKQNQNAMTIICKEDREIDFMRTQHGGKCARKYLENKSNKIIGDKK